MYTKIIKQAEELSGQLKKWRRDFHRYPELGWMEMRTSSLIARYLKEMGYENILVGPAVCLEESRMGLPSPEALEEHYRWAAENGGDPEFLPASRGGFTGVIATLPCGEGPTAALRFDIDALPISEASEPGHFPFENGFASENKGVMHACGHDGHTAIGLGTAKILMENRDMLRGTVKLIFQPSEEGVRGAKSIADHGHLEGVDYILGGHMGGDSSVTSPYVSAGSGATLATAKLNISFRGTATHAAISPHLGGYAMLAAATAVLNLHAIPRHGDASTRVNVGKISGGTARNIVCDQVTLEMEVRGKSSAANDYMLNYAKRIAEQAAAMHGCSCEIQMMGAAKCGANSPHLTQRLLEVCREQLGLASVRAEALPSGSEDFSYLSDFVISRGGQACYFSHVVPCAGSFHNRLFDFNEAALENGVKAFCGVTASLLSPKP